MANHHADDTTSQLPTMTGALPGLGGRLKSIPADFVVEEIPAFEPSGEGDHLYLWIEKQDVAAEHLVSHIARTLSISRQDVGAAGLKDRRAITRQTISLPASCAERVLELETDAIRVLRIERHRHKLRTGQLRGNRFTVLLRNVSTDTMDLVSKIKEIILQRGVPNYFGEQRFGHDGSTLDLGLDLLTARKSDRELPRSRRKFLKRLSLSAVQSWLFNQALADRIGDELIDKVLVGDVMQRIESGGCFLAENQDEEQNRFAVRETVMTGPIFGHKMLGAQGVPGQRELVLLQCSRLDDEAFLRFKKLTPGGRTYFSWSSLILFPKRTVCDFSSRYPREAMPRCLCASS